MAADAEDQTEEQWLGKEQHQELQQGQQEEAAGEEEQGADQDDADDSFGFVLRPPGRAPSSAPWLDRRPARGGSAVPPQQARSRRAFWRHSSEQAGGHRGHQQPESASPAPSWRPPAPHEHQGTSSEQQLQGSESESQPSSSTGGFRPAGGNACDTRPPVPPRVTWDAQGREVLYMQVLADATRDDDGSDGSGCDGSGCDGSGCDGSGCGGSGCDDCVCASALPLHKGGVLVLRKLQALGRGSYGCAVDVEVEAPPALVEAAARRGQPLVTRAVLKYATGEGNLMGAEYGAMVAAGRARCPGADGFCCGSVPWAQVVRVLAGGLVTVGSEGKQLSAILMELAPLGSLESYLLAHRRGVPAKVGAGVKQLRPGPCKGLVGARKSGLAAPLCCWGGCCCGMQRRKLVLESSRTQPAANAPGLCVSQARHPAKPTPLSNALHLAAAAAPHVPAARLRRAHYQLPHGAAGHAPGEASRARVR